MLLLLCGLPGSGKNYVGNVFREEFGFFFYDADEDLPDLMKQTITQGLIPTDEMREAHYRQVIERLRGFCENHRNVVVANAFLKEKYRRLVLGQFLEAKLVLVRCEPGILEARLENRFSHLVTGDYANKLQAIFEEPTMGHLTIENNQPGRDAIRRQITRMIMGFQNNLSACSNL